MNDEYILWFIFAGSLLAIYFLYKRQQNSNYDNTQKTCSNVGIILLLLICLLSIYQMTSLSNKDSAQLFEMF